MKLVFMTVVMGCCDGSDSDPSCGLDWTMSEQIAGNDTLLQSHSEWFRGKRIALHAQTTASVHGFVSGSEYTCLGLKHAFQQLGAKQVKIFSPGLYGAPAEEDSGNIWDHWDLVIIEGWFDMIETFINTIRATNDELKFRNEFDHQPLILYFCLDIYSEYHFDRIKALNVDGYLTNSKKMVEALSSVGPTKLLHLAVSNHNALDDFHRVDKRYQHDVVFIGQWTEKKQHLVPMLREAAEFDLAIYGFGWNQTEFRDYYRGVLPLDDLLVVYDNAKVAIGCTEDSQRMNGMINNRVFEVLSRGTYLINDYFPELEQLFHRVVDNQLFFYRNPGDVKRYLATLLDRPGVSKIAPAQTVVARSHTYFHRALELETFLNEIVGERNGRRNARRVGVLIYRTVPPEQFDTGFVRAMDLLDLGNLYNVTWINLADYVKHNGSEGNSSAVEVDIDLESLKSSFDVILVKSNWHWFPDTFARQYLRNDRTIRLMLAVSGVAPPPRLDEMLIYDVLFVETHWYASLPSIKRHPRVIHAFGVDTDVMKPIPGIPKSWDYLGIGSLIWYKRPQLLGEKKSGARAWVGDISDESIAKQMRENGVRILSPRSPKELAILINAAKRVYIPSQIDGGGERAVLEAKACGVEVQVETDNPKLVELSKLDRVWDHKYYAFKLQFGLTLGFAFGRARSKISMLHPSANIVISEGNEAGWYVEVVPEIKEFIIGRDGFWCIHALEYGTETESTLCIADYRIRGFLRVPSGNFRLRLFVSLRANVFSDVIRTSDSIDIDVNTSTRVEVAQERPCLSPMDDHTCNALLQGSDPYFQVMEFETLSLTEIDIDDVLELDLATERARWLWYSSEDLNAEADAKLRIAGYSSRFDVRFRLWGQGAVSLANTKRRSIVLELANKTSQFRGLGSRFILLSLHEDETKLAYMTGIRAMASIWQPFAKLVWFKLANQERGTMYLLSEHPFDTARRLGAEILGQRNLDEDIVQVSERTFVKHTGRVWDIYNDLIRHLRVDYLRRTINVEKYLKWLAFNNILANGDFIDEVFFFPSTPGSSQLEMFPWDLDSLFSPCHMSGYRAVKNDVLFYCAESQIDHFIARTPELRNELERVTRDLLQALDPIQFCSVHLRKTFEDANHLHTKFNMEAIPFRGYAKLCHAFESRYRSLSRELLFKDYPESGPQVDTKYVSRKHPHPGTYLNENGSKYVVIDPVRGESEYGLEPWTPVIRLAAEHWLDVKVEAISPRFPNRNISDIPVVLLWDENTETPTRFDVRCYKAERLQFSTVLVKSYGMTMFNVPANCSKLVVNHVLLHVYEHLHGQTPSLDLCAVQSDLDHHYPFAKYHVSRVGCTIHSHVTLEHGSVVVIDPGSTIEVNDEASLTILGTKTDPVVFTSSSGYWGGFTLNRGALLNASFSIFQKHGHGIAPTTPGERYMHHRERALFEIYQGAKVWLRNSYLSDGIGQAFSIADGSLVTIEDTLVQRFVSGGEVFDSELNIDRTVFTEFPSDDRELFADEDNDALYIIGGGKVTIRDSVLALAKDDCIDSGTGFGGLIRIENTLFDSCWHEGLAITNQERDAGGEKTVIVVNSTFRNNQQGVELGWSSPDLVVELRNCSFVSNQVGVRFGDNYEAHVRGFLSIRDCSFSDNKYDTKVLCRDRSTANLVHTHLVGPSFPVQGGSRSAKDGNDEVVQGKRLVELNLSMNGKSNISVVYHEGDDMSELASRACNQAIEDANMTHPCVEQVISYLHTQVANELHRGEEPMFSLTVNIENGTAARFLVYPGEDLFHRAYGFCKGHGLGLSCFQALIGRFREENHMKALPKDPIRGNSKLLQETHLPVSAVSSFIRSHVLETDEKFSFVEHTSSVGNCRFARAMAKTFIGSVSSVCSTSSPGFHARHSSSDDWLLLQSLDLSLLYDAPDMVDVQTCFSECSFISSSLRFAKFLSLARFSLVDLGGNADPNYIANLLDDAAAQGLPIEIEIVPLGALPGLWACKLVSMKRDTRHHYNADFTLGWLPRHYSVQVDHGRIPHAIRSSDAKRIPFLHRGYSLQTMLEANPSNATRQVLFQQFTNMAVAEDMAPWNLLYTDRGKLLYVDSQSRLTADLNPNYMYTVIKLLDCFPSEPHIQLHSNITRMFQSCLARHFLPSC